MKEEIHRGMTSPERVEDVPILAKITSGVEKWRLTPHMELEVRLGTIEDNRNFKPCVTHADSSRLFKAMTDEKSLVQWDGRPEPLKFWYKYYPMTKPTDYNNKEYFPPFIRGQFFPDREPVYHMIMKSRQVVDVRCVERPYDMRISLKVERPIQIPPNHVWTADRCKTVSRFSIEHLGRWRYDFSHAGYGRTQEEACKNYQFEVELEAVREKVPIDNDAFAVELLGRARDLLGRYEEVENRDTGLMERRRVVVRLELAE